MFGASWLALEPRIMFDGAAVTTVDSIATEQLAQGQAESSLSRDDATAYPDAAPTGEPQFSSSDQALFDALAAYDTSAARQEIVFLSPSIRDYQRLLDNMSPHVEVFMLVSTREGVQQVTEVLAGRTGIDTLHLIAEGNEAELHLGTSVLTRDSLSTRYAEAFQHIGQSLSAEADMLIYGCNFGRGAAGQSAISTLANLTGADVAASTDLTGAAGLGGDWTLEVNTGAVESAIAVTREGRAAYSHVLDISSGLLGHWTFDTNADDSSGNNYNGILTNGAAIDTTSSTNIVGAGKVSLDGVNDFVDLTGHKANFEGLSQGTIAMWVRTTDAHMELFSLSDTADQNSLVALYVTSAGTLGFDMLENDVNILDARSVISINDGQWHHVAVTVDAGGTKLYVDGAEAPVNYLDGNSASTAFFDDVTGIDIMQIGRNTNSSGHRLHYDGLIDDVRVYNRALTSVDMGELYDTGNAAPVITNLAGDSLAYSEGAGAMVIEQGGKATVSDVDSADFSGGTLTVRFTAGSDSAEDVLSITNQGTGAGQIGVSGSSVTYGGVTIGTFTGGSGGSNLVITFNSSATPTAATALIQNITYENTDTAAPTTGARTVRFVLTDGDGGTSANYNTSVTVSSVNDAPVNTVPGAQVIGEDGSLVFSAGNGNQIGISDIDAAGGIMHITLTAANGTLTLNGTTGLSFITGDGTTDSTMTFTGTIADINMALNGIGFLPTLNYNGPASVQMITDDQGNTGGAVQSDTDTVAITVTAGNDPPVNSIPGPQGTPQNTTLVFSAGNGNQIGISDVDAAGAMMHITLTSANGTLSLNGTTGLSFITGDGTTDGTMTFTGTVADINTALNGMGFLPALNYNGAASVQVTTDDQGNTGGVAQSDVDTVSIIVSNNLPPVVTMSSGSLSYTENDGDVAIDTGLTVADADNATLAGATVRITGSYVNGEDLLAFTNQLGITGSWNAGTGELTLTGSVTVADYHTALRSITYTNLSNAPSTGTRTVSFSVNDSVVDSAITTRTITIAAVNDPPAVGNLSGDSLAYSEDDGAVVLEQGGNATVSDVDSADFNSGTLTVRFTAGTDSAEDVLAIRNQGAGAGQIGVSGSNVTYGGVTIGTFTGGTAGSNLVITLNSSATPTAVTALVKNLTYENSDTATPTTGARTVQIVLTDGDGGTSANYDVTVTVSSVNDVPVNSVPGAQSVNEDTPFSLAGISVNDVDENLSTVQMGVTNGTVTVTLQGAATISAGDNGTNTLTLSGTQADINATLASLVYQGALHDAGADMLTVTSTDSTSLTDVDTVDITVTAVNDVPVNSVPGAQSVNEDTPLSLAGISVNDVDENLSTVQLGVLNGTVTVTLQGAATISAGGNGTDTLTLSGTQADINATLAGLVYQGALHYNGADTVTVTSMDSTGVTDIDTVDLTLNAENDAPTITALVDQTILEDGTTGTLGFTVSDVETAAGGLSVTASSSDTARIPNGNLTLVDLGSGNWTITAAPTLNQNGGPLTITVTVNDGTTTTNETFDVTVMAQNDLPVMTANTGSTVVQGEIDTVTNAELQTIDVENTPSQLTYTVAVAPGNGQLELTSVPGVAIASFTQAQINAGLVVYVHDGSLTANDGFIFTVTDGAGGNISATTFGITITLLNSNPVLTVNAGSMAVQGLSDPITTGELRITDANNSPGQLIYTVTAAPSNGQLELTNAPGVAVTTFTQADIDAGRLVFVHSGAATTSDSFTFIVSDGAGGSLGATTFRFDVAPFIPPPGGGGGHSGGGESSTGGFGITGSGSASGLGSESRIASSGTVIPPPELMRAEIPVKNVSIVGATQDPLPKAVIANRFLARMDQADPVIQEPPLLLFEPLSIPVKKVLTVGHKLVEHLTRVADDLERGVQDRESQDRLVGRVASFSGMALSAGFVAWILRGGSLLASFLVSMPVWRHFDPLPVLGMGEGDRRKRDRKIREEDVREKREFRGLDRVLKSSQNDINRKRKGA